MTGAHLPDGVADLMRSANATRAILSDPDHYAQALYKLLEGKAVKRKDTAVVVAALEGGGT